MYVCLKCYRKAYEGVVEDGKLFYKNSGEMLQTSTMDNNDSKWIMVLRCYTLGRRGCLAMVRA
ncbi:hypothetical protein DY000_02035334 [Brassica cretica]|uniref:Uncharacterized protein n=1 Tax=Brassica cretica TaxID=69181 RepID=A0ABQ7DWV8_BRACR|nr:hypothetical protein DY000_02035334 [Brassica cretica]